MRVLTAMNPDQGLNIALDQVLTFGLAGESRNGPVLRFPTPVTTVWATPLNRVSYSEVRDANPFLHLMEAMWMLAGRNDVETVGFYAKQMLAYSDDGVSLNAAYGFRWRHHFGRDQLDEAVEILKKDPASRQVVVQIWDSEDLTKSTKDKACNTQAMFDIVEGKLNMTITNRSNDIIWGCYGANVVHFSFLLEYMANRLGVPVGTYYQVSNNLHLYTEFDITKRFVNVYNDADDTARHYSPVYGSREYAGLYQSGMVQPMRLGSEHSLFENELLEIVDDYKETKRILRAVPFFNQVVEPIRCAYACWKAGEQRVAREIIDIAEREYLAGHLAANDWLTAASRWMNRRLNK